MLALLIRRGPILKGKRNVEIRAKRAENISYVCGMVTRTRAELSNDMSVIFSCVLSWVKRFSEGAALRSLKVQVGKKMEARSTVNASLFCS